jgi:5-methylcytosine-specific restriction protein B
MDEFRSDCLQHLRSAFLPESDLDAVRVWTDDSALELIHGFIEQPDISKRSFVEKLRDQLDGVSRPADQLLVELTWLHVVISRPLRYETKHKLLADVASIAGAQPATGIFDTALRRGLVKTGTSFTTRRPNQLWLLIRFAEAWLAATSEQRDTWLRDAWAFRELVFGLEGVADQTQRHALLHLVHPDTFEDCVSQYHKRGMASLATPDEVAPNDDVTIANVRRRLTVELGDGFDFYADGVRERWQADDSDRSIVRDESIDEDKPDELVTDRSAWLIRGSGGERVPDWLDRGVCAIGFEDSFPFELEVGASRDALRRLSEEAGVDVTAGGFNNELGQVWRFVNKIEVGDYIVTVNGSDVYLGVVESPPRNTGARTRKETARSVEWLNAEKPVARSQIAPSVYSKLRTLLTVRISPRSSTSSRGGSRIARGKSRQAYPVRARSSLQERVRNWKRTSSSLNRGSTRSFVSSKRSDSSSSTVRRARARPSSPKDSPIT